MQTISRGTYFFSILLAASVCHAAEEHLMIDRTGESIIHFAEAAPPSSTQATNLLNPWSVVWDANDQAVYWTEIGSGSIFRKYIDGGNIEEVFHSDEAVLRGLVLNSASNVLYFLDSNDDSLNEFNIATSNKIILTAGFYRPNDMDFDARNNQLYITDSGHNRVYRFDLNTYTQEFLLEGALVDGVWGIDVVPETGHLYLSDHSTNAIMRADLNGSNLTVLVKNQETPRGLCVDRHHRRLYWLEAESGELRSSTLDGLDVQSVLTNISTSVRDLASYEFFDQDGDFMSDARERSYFGHLHEAAYGDADGDQLDNLSELAFGSSPTDPNDNMPGTQISFLEGVGPMLGYYMRTEGWMRYNLLHSADLQQWDPVPLVDELMSIPNGEGGATRIITMDETLNMFGDKQFFKVEVQH